MGRLDIFKILWGKREEVNKWAVRHEVRFHRSVLSWLVGKP